MKAKPSRWSAARARLSSPRTRPTRPEFFGYQIKRPRSWSPGAFLLARLPVLSARLLVEPALEHADIADVGAEHDVEGVARHRHQADHAVDRDIAQHPRRDMPGRTQRTRLAHDPERNRRRDDIADHRDQADQPVDAVADIGAGYDEGDVQQLCQCIEPR